jgi:peptidoglycan/xylan/chitin deacetylase (PgdA/CDA1 family)
MEGADSQMASCLYPVFPGGKLKALTLSYDDGVEQDKKLISLMEKHNVKATFNINSGLYAPDGHVWPRGHIHRRMGASECRKVFDHPLVEVATHGYDHPFYAELPQAMVLADIMRDRAALEEQFGRIIRGHAYPYGSFNDDVADLLKKAGIVYARTVISHHGFRLPHDFLKWEATCHHNDGGLESLTKRFLDEEPARGPLLFYLWGHSYEFESDGNWHVIENFLDEISGREEIWYAANIDISDYLRDYGRLVFDAGCTRAYNPASGDIWFGCGGKVLKVPPGAEIVI